MEIFKDIEGYDGHYQISNLGNVKSLKLGKDIIRKPNKTTKGKYVTLWVALSKRSKTKKYYIHRLVAKHFIKNPLNKKEVNHKDNNPLNNKVSNLEWVTHDENMKYAMKEGRIAKGETSGMSKFTEEDVIEIYKSKIDALTLSKKYKVSRQSIYDIKNGNMWTHITKKL